VYYLLNFFAVLKKEWKKENFKKKMGKGIPVSIQVKEKFMYAYMANGRGDCGLYKAVVRIISDNISNIRTTAL
jgi:hypothetical protein